MKNIEEELKEPECVTKFLNYGFDGVGAGRVFTIDCNDEYCINAPLSKILETMEYIDRLKEKISELEKGEKR